MQLKYASTSQLKELLELISNELNSRLRQQAKQQFMVKAVKRNRAAMPFDLQSQGVGDVLAYYQYAHRKNSEKPRSLRVKDMRSKANDMLKYLACILDQDWSHLFPNDSCSAADYYVYAHCDPRRGRFNSVTSLGGATGGLPFYVGKGRGRRAWDFKRNQGHGLRLKEVAAAGFAPDDIIHIFRSDLTESKAYELEAKLVYFLGTIYEEDRSGILLNLDTCRRPQFEEEMIRMPAKKVVAGWLKSFSIGEITDGTQSERCGNSL